MIQWTWDWANSGRWRSLASCSSWDHKDWTWLSDWTKVSSENSSEAANDEYLYWLDPHKKIKTKTHLPCTHLWAQSLVQSPPFHWIMLPKASLYLLARKPSSCLLTILDLLPAFYSPCGPPWFLKHFIPMTWHIVLLMSLHLSGCTFAVSRGLIFIFLLVILNISVIHSPVPPETAPSSKSPCPALNSFSLYRP